MQWISEKAVRYGSGIEYNALVAKTNYKLLGADEPFLLRPHVVILFSNQFDNSMELIAKKPLCCQWCAGKQAPIRERYKKESTYIKAYRAYETQRLACPYERAISDRRKLVYIKSRDVERNVKREKEGFEIAQTFLNHADIFGQQLGISPFSVLS